MIESLAHLRHSKIMNNRHSYKTSFNSLFVRPSKETTLFVRPRKHLTEEITIE